MLKPSIQIVAYLYPTIPICKKYILICPLAVVNIVITRYISITASYRVLKFKHGTCKKCNIGGKILNENILGYLITG